MQKVRWRVRGERLAGVVWLCVTCSWEVWMLRLHLVSRLRRVHDLCCSVHIRYVARAFFQLCVQCSAQQPASSTQFG